MPQKKTASRVLKSMMNALSFGLIFFIAVVFFLHFYIKSFSKEFTFNDLEQFPEVETALILGASVQPDRSLSTVLKDRADTAIELYHSGKIKQILVSGDYKPTYDEVTPVAEYLLSNGVDSLAILKDFGGYNTDLSIRNADRDFGISTGVIVTQASHLPRAIYLARKRGMNYVGFEADRRAYQKNLKQFNRELIANLKAFVNVQFYPSQPEEERTE
ncbi:MAG: ElyC/SanA/YdcF family protein [Flavobacteriaceae bacterium]|nr:ElyC/SanA/YdcF family protein [Flavobacteriaceae bacterium]